MANHLAGEKSPYLLQHADNPVDWYPWGDAAFEKARRENRPIFLSIGYATCHWCHVMAHESFEDKEVAAFLNRHFVPIKVDREERPDLDALYMSACQALTGRGGWPLSVFLTPDGKPFYAGTYFPRNSRFGMPGFLEILQRIADLWQNQPKKIREAGEQILALLEKGGDLEPVSTPLSSQTLQNAYTQLRQQFDPRWGGFGNAPKFPTPHRLTFLLRWHHRTKDLAPLKMVGTTLYAMRRGGIFDQIGYGFHRYSVDARWQVPHFEKMLYDQATLMMAYAEAYQATKNPFYANTVREIFDYLEREMKQAGGGFFSAEDADSEGREGAFYLWTPAEIRRILGPDRGALTCRFFGITEKGNFEDGMSIPAMPVLPEDFILREGMSLEEWQVVYETSRQALLKERERRVHPLKDDKVLTSWNGLMTAALALASVALNEAAMLDAARETEAFLWDKMFQEGELYHRFRDGDVGIKGFLEDNTFLTWGLIELYEATLETEYLEKAVRLQDRTCQLFWDDGRGGFFLSQEEGLSPLKRRIELYDGAIPSANSVALSNLLRLGSITGKTEYLSLANRMLRGFAAKVASSPAEYCHFLNGLDVAVGPSGEIVVMGKKGDARVSQVMRKIRETYLPDKELIFYEPGDSRMIQLCPYLESFPDISGHFSVFICENRVCREPINSLEKLENYLEKYKIKGLSGFGDPV